MGHHYGVRSDKGKDDEKCHDMITNLRAHADNIKQRHLGPLEEEAAHLKATMEFREMLKGMENQRFQKLRELCKKMKEKMGTDAEKDATIEFERALEVARMMS